MLTFGQIQDGLEVMHICDTPACVNPAHLVLGTHADNMADAARKKRMKNVRNGRKLTDAEVRAVRIDPRKHHIIAAAFGISRRAVLAVKHRESWASLD